MPGALFKEGPMLPICEKCGCETLDSLKHDCLESLCSQKRLLVDYAAKIRALELGLEYNLSDEVIRGITSALTETATEIAQRTTTVMKTAEKALQAREWHGNSGGHSPVCLWCGGYERHPAMDQDYYGKPGHKVDCLRQEALESLHAFAVMRGAKRV